MLYREIIAVCSQIHTKHKNCVGRTYNCWMLNWRYITWPLALKRLNSTMISLGQNPQIPPVRTVRKLSDSNTTLSQYKDLRDFNDTLTRLCSWCNIVVTLHVIYIPSARDTSDELSRNVSLSRNIRGGKKQVGSVSVVTCGNAGRPPVHPSVRTANYGKTTHIKLFYLRDIISTVQ